MKILTYTELIKLPTFDERYEYLKLGGKVGQETFGRDRYLNQALYNSDFWKKEVRPHIIARDGGYDLGVYGMEIVGLVVIHHMNPITIEDALNHDPKVYDPENLITVSERVHRGIHYGVEKDTLLVKPFAERKPNDTCPWRR